jgi:hypothetical protein
MAARSEASATAVSSRARADDRAHVAGDFTLRNADTVVGKFVDRYGRDAGTCRRQAELARKFGSELRSILAALDDKRVTLGRAAGKRQLARLEASAERFDFVANRDEEIAQLIDRRNAGPVLDARGYPDRRLAAYGIHEPPGQRTPVDDLYGPHTSSGGAT